MSVIVIAAPSADAEGSCTFKYNALSEVGSLVRRVSRVATLDGGVVINDLGFTHGDRTFSVRAALTKAMTDKLNRILRLYPTVTIAVEEGVFLGAIQSNSITGNVSNLTILIKEKLTS